MSRDQENRSVLVRLIRSMRGRVYGSTELPPVLLQSDRRLLADTIERYMRTAYIAGRVEAANEAAREEASLERVLGPSRG